MRFVAIFIILICSLDISAQQSWNVDLEFHWDDTTLISNFRDARYSDIWGFSLDNRKYVVMGSTYGAHFFDITTPAQTAYIGAVPGAFQGYDVNHRDYKEYRGYIYACAQQGQATLQIIDANYLPDSVHLVYDSDTLFGQAHNVFVDTSNARLYACGPNSDALKVFSLQDPEKPILLKTYNDVSYVHDIYANGDTVYLNCGNDGFYIVDMADTSNFQTLGSLTLYPDQGYNHNGWLTDDGGTYVFTDENYGRKVKICDVSDFGNISILSTLTSGVSDSSVAHNAFIMDNILYLSYYNDGFQMFNISDPINPVKIGYYDTFLPNQKDDFRGAWGCYPFFGNGIVAISDRNSGLYILNVSAAVTSVDNNLERQVNANVYPNPTAGEITVTGQIPLRIQLYNASGIEVMNFENINKLDIAHLANGIYFLRTTDGTSTFMFKIVKQSVY
jgi:choice-of-anchor B domain-containing protein